MSAPSALETKFQRDLNRTLDNDRNTRKRGLQKLLEDLPWTSKRKEFVDFLLNSVLRSLLVTLSDQVEKCRELTLQLLRKTVDVCGNAFDNGKTYDLVKNLCDRINNEAEFREPAEELRLEVVELLHTVIKTHHAVDSADATADMNSLVERILLALAKTLNDPFPKVKRACAELICTCSVVSAQTVRTYFKPLLKGLEANAKHQQFKIRSVSLHAIGSGITTVGTEEYESLMKDAALPLFAKLVGDDMPSVRIELSAVCATIVAHRVTHCRALGAALVKMDLEVFALLVVLAGDELDEVAAHAKANLSRAVANWHAGIVLQVDTNMGQFSENSHIVDGEAEMSAAMSIEGCEDSSEVVPINSASAAVAMRPEDFVQANLRELLGISLQGCDNWKAKPKKQALRGLEKLIIYSEDKLDSLLPRLLLALGAQIRDDEAEIRHATEQCCTRLGAQCDAKFMLEILLPRVAGEVAGGDTYQQRASAVRVLTHVVKGFPENSALCASPVDSSDLILSVSGAVANPLLYEFREAVLREASLLLVRTVLQLYPALCHSSVGVQRNLTLALVYLCGRCPGEDDLVCEFASKELHRLAAVSASGDSSAAAASSTEAQQVEFLLSVHYEAMFAVITKPSSAVKSAKSSSSPASAASSNPNWEPRSPAKSAFDVLVRNCPTESWVRHAVVIPIFTMQVQPVVGPAAGSAEANAISYAAQRGEDLVTNTTDVDVRLSLLALLEGLIRAGSASWECGRHIAEASETIMKSILLPNLIWRIGKVEATVRKVALATTYALLKAGAVKPETLFKVASELVPMLVSNLDDSELTPRQITCLCLTVVFERLRGAFGEQSVREIYPKLVARLDDSNDTVRIAICGTLNMFLQCAPRAAYSSTTVDYTLDQLFIHLDDPDPAVQQAVLQVVVTASRLDKELVLKKAASSRGSHRSPAMCDKISFEVSGFEILPDEDDVIDCN